MKGVAGEVVTTSSPVVDEPRTAADPVATAVIRGGLNSAAKQMVIALRRAAHSLVIYEMADFAVGLLDDHYRLLAQGTSLPVFMGTLNFVVENCVNAVGGPSELRVGDVLITSDCYANGAHANDVALIAPSFVDDVLVGYSVVKGHFMDVGGIESFSVNTRDSFQEGLNLPGVRLYHEGVLNRDIFRIAIANSRMPISYEGDLMACVGACRHGAEALETLVRRFGLKTFRSSSLAIFDHGELRIREFLSQIPDGRYESVSTIDSNGLDDEPVPIKTVVEVKGSDVTIDVSDCAGPQRSSLNAPMACTVSVARLAVIDLAIGGETHNEGWLRPIHVRTRVGSMLHALPPTAVQLYLWAPLPIVDGVYNALGKALPDLVPAATGGDIGFSGWFATRESGSEWATVNNHFVGLGASAFGDAPPPMMHICCSGVRNNPAEVLEHGMPFVVRRYEIAPDSGGPGRFRGGAGTNIEYEIHEDCLLTLVFDQTTTTAMGRAGGSNGLRPNKVRVFYPDGTIGTRQKISDKILPKGSRVYIEMAGGGGFGPPSERSIAAIADDMADGYVTEASARKFYPHAFVRTSKHAAE